MLMLYYNSCHLCTCICSTIQQHDPCKEALIENMAFNYSLSVCNDNSLELPNNRYSMHIAL